MSITSHMKITGAVLGAALAGAVAVVPFTNNNDDGGGRPTGRDIVLADSMDAVPSNTATDWVSYGDQAAVVHVDDEHAGSATAEEDAAGEGYLSRTVDMTVKERVWARSGAPVLPDTLSVLAEGWEFTGDSRIRIASHDSPRVEVGHDYLIVFAHFSDGEWSPLGSGGILPYDDGQIGQGEYQGRVVTATSYRSTMASKLISGDEEPVAFRAAGNPTSSVRTLLQGATPNATAAQHFSLDAIARFQKVTGVTQPADTFCAIAAPLAVSAASKYAPDELASVISDLAGMDEGVASMRSYVSVLRTGTSADWTSSAGRKSSIATIEAECGIEVGDLLPNDTDGTD